MPKVKVGDTIKINHLTDEPFNSNYQGKTGVVKYIEEDPWGDERMIGTWGQIFIYIDKDDYEIIKKAAK